VHPEPWGFLVRAMAYETLADVVTAVSIAALAFAVTLVVFRGQLQDVFLRVRGPAPISGEVAVLPIGSEALYLWDPADPTPDVTPRALLAELVGFLDEAGATVVALDFLLDRPAPGDDALIAAARAHGAVLCAERFVADEPGRGRRFVPGTPPDLAAAIPAGFTNFEEESSFWGGALLVRRLPLVTVADRAHLSGTWPDNQVGGNQDLGQLVPSLALAAAWRHRAGRDVAADGLWVRLAEACADGECAATELGVPLGATPRALLQPYDINYRGSEAADPFPTIDAERVLRWLGEARLFEALGGGRPAIPEDLRSMVEGRVVLVGRVAPRADGSRDRFTTPYAVPFPSEPDMAGVRVHAHVVDALLSGRHLRHRGGVAAWMLAGIAAAAVFASYRRIGDTLHGLGGLLASLGWLIFGFVVFVATDGVVFDVGPAVAGTLVPLTLLHLRGWVREQAGLDV
jgi:CHASE2 domain-containing sensor protein